MAAQQGRDVDVVAGKRSPQQRGGLRADHVVEMQNRTDVKRDCLVGTPVPSQVELGCLTVAADLQLDEVTVRGGAQQAYLKAVAGQRCLDRFEHAAGTAGLRREQVHVLGRPAE